MGETEQPSAVGKGTVGPPDTPKEVNPPPGLLHGD